MGRRLSELILLLNKQLVLFLSISVGIFLFFLFFQPFPHDNFDFYYRLIFKAGPAAILFLIMFMVRVFYPCLLGNISKDEKEIILSSVVSGSIIWVLSSFAFICYLKYVGHISITGYLVFKVILICIAPPAILLVSDKMRKLRMENKSLLSEKEETKKQAIKNKEDHQNLSIDFYTGVNGGKLNFLLSDILFMKSANNYVEIYYLEKDQVNKKLIRNTLRNVELQIKPYPTLIRCHRTYIVNTHYIEKQTGNCNNHTISIRGYQEQIPVSRQYYLKINEVN